MGPSGVTFTDRIDGLTGADLSGFFVGWKRRPSAALRLAVLHRSDHVAITCDEQNGTTVGFVTALTDGVLAAQITLLEVLPEYQGRGIGTELVRRVLTALGPLYMIDAACDDELLPFYQQLGATPVTGVAWRT